ncbi:G2/M phase-specific E3 ubiquitin-protein ligase-like [Pelmatolapia mariae]|uniref:G2/M phase-specific E3 ubiquitin-protein ligase-like n=1 Tax=Pelmatolapia mariae TaxID=158779 RepID=UPI003211E4E1
MDPEDSVYSESAASTKTFAMQLAHASDIYSQERMCTCTMLSNSAMLRQLDIRHQKKKKTWDNQTVVKHIKESFGERIPEDVSLEFLMACGNKLVSPKLQDGQELNGMLILKVFKTKALYSESDEDKDPSHISSKSALSSSATDKDSDNDCFEVDSSKIQQDMSSQVTTRLRSHVKGDNPGTSSDEEDDTGTNCIGRSVALRGDWYYISGKAIAVSLVHGGPPPNFLSPTVFSLLVGNSANPALEDIADLELFEKVKKISQSTTLEDLEKSKEPLLDYLANAGCLRPVRSLRDRDLLVHDIVMFQVIHRVQGPFQRFCEGLKTLGVLEKMRRHPDGFRPLFCYEPHMLTADQVDDLFNIHLSPEGSNRRAAEEMVVTFWRDHLQDAEEEKGPSKLQKILAFATGATAVPPIGFSPAPSIEFIHRGDDDFSSTPIFPLANTCVNCIRLPLHVSYQLFKEKFDFALGNTYGFGRV